MTTTIYKYRLYCETDSQFEYSWAEEEPSLCPTNSNHTIDLTSISIVDQRSGNIIKIQEERIPTGENFMCESHKITCATGPNIVSSKSYTWPFPISVLELQFVSNQIHQGDSVEVKVAPDTITGILTADCPTGATGITVSQTVIDNTMKGYHLNLFDGVNTEDLGRVKEIDNTNNKINIEIPTTKSFSAATPTYVRQTVYVVKNYEIGLPQRYKIGEGKIGGSHIPENTQVVVEYTNTTSTSKDFYSQIEYLY